MTLLTSLWKATTLTNPGNERFQRRGTTPLLRSALIFGLFCGLLITAAQTAQAQTYTVLYSFCSQPNCADGAFPNARLILDGAGNLFGTTAGGGSQACFGRPCGTVFQLAPDGTETVLHAFTGSDGSSPSSGLIRDTSGNLFGTMNGGGNGGAIFKVTPGGVESILYPFSGIGASSVVTGGLVVDAGGNIYGTTLGNGERGPASTGTAFKLSTAGEETVLHSFIAYSGDGKFPRSGLIMDGQGNLYGTTSAGGRGGRPGPIKSHCVNGCGTVFEINPAGVESTLHAFKGWMKKNADAAEPYSDLVIDAQGNLFGTTSAGGTYGSGAVFEITASGTEKVLHSFSGADGALPLGGLVVDGQGNLYGTTWEGGANGVGTIFEITAAGTGKVLYNFTGGADGANPHDGLVLDAAGNIYGTTHVGGNLNSNCLNPGCGVVFKVTP